MTGRSPTCLDRGSFRTGMAAPALQQVHDDFTPDGTELTRATYSEALAAYPDGRAILADVGKRAGR
ncbi:hypothetical protein ACFYY2_34030 [Streptomyces sp. NPDC001822]|uniref:hypothetical protein n=1 Tax=Streptomyces sp. NPDC001822 TaxID=3364614 RepID=UPI0036843944